MPHFSIEYSRNIENLVDFPALCDSLRRAGIKTGVFAVAGIRVRATACDHYSIADGFPDRGFIDISVRLRGGRPLELRKAATQAVFSAAREFLADVMDRYPIALSLEMRNIDPELSPKLSSIRKFMTGDS